MVAVAIISALCVAWLTGVVTWAVVRWDRRKQQRLLEERMERASTSWDVFDTLDKDEFEQAYHRRYTGGQ